MRHPPKSKTGCIHFVMGFTSPSMGDGLNTGPMAVWMENTETAAVVVVGSFIFKKIYLVELQR